MAHSRNACALLGILTPNIEAAFPATPGPGATHQPAGASMPLRAIQWTGCALLASSKGM
ncbi:hypothetical protein [Citrobacter portucalensis]|uniref:hypothetical protein n=1 Tax=Citrobacter portucalensis TaxID=1639133 RepID=UPI0038903855